MAYRFHDGDQDSIKLRNIANGSTVQTMPTNTGGYSNLAFSPDGSLLASASSYKDYIIHLWKVSDGSEIRTIQGHDGGITALAFALR